MPTCAHSIVYRTIAREANTIATSRATYKHLLVFSDLAEHTPDISFYDPRTIDHLQKSPQSFAQQLEATLPLKQLNGVDVWFLYNPSNYAKNNAYMKIAGFYQHMFTAHGAVPHVANKFQPL